MVSTFISFFKPPDSNSFEEAQKFKFLHISLLVIAGASILLGFLNAGDDTNLDLYLFAFSGVSILGVQLNKLGYFKPTAFVVSTLMLVLTTFGLIDGVGLKDAGMIAFPIYIIYTIFLFGKGTAILTTLASMGAATIVYYLGQWEMLTPAKYTDEANLRALLVLLLTTGGFLWAVMNSWEKVAQNLRETYDLTLSGWAKALEYRDHETQGHSHRVIEMTLELAKHLGISEEDLNHIRRGALLHDIGKMSVPDSILLKAGELTDDEWEVMKRHPIKAKELLKDIPFLKPALAIPYSHHERWNGSGYPEGLSKDNIPLPARIFAVVDVWDALTSDRPYRLAWSDEKAKAYIREGSGRLFDPQVVEAFLEIKE